MACGTSTTDLGFVPCRWHRRRRKRARDSHSFRHEDRPAMTRRRRTTPRHPNPHVCTHVCAHVCAHVCTHVCAHVCAHVCTPVYAHFCTHKKAEKQHSAATPKSISGPLELGTMPRRMSIHMCAHMPGHVSAHMSIHVFMRLSVHIAYTQAQPSPAARQLSAAEEAAVCL